MKFLIVLAVALAAANAGVITHSVVAPVAHGTTLQGPSTRTTVVGPEGSVISAVAPGGAVHASTDFGYAAHAAPAVVAARYAAPVVSAYAAPYATPYATTYAAHGVVSAYNTPYLAHHGVYAPGVVARSVYGAPLAVVPSGHGLEGQYVPDYTEKLYDDGSYKGEIY